MEGIRIWPRRSYGDRLWVDPVYLPDEAPLRRFCDNLGIPLALGRILAGRNLLDEAEAYLFLHPEEGQLHPPFLLKDMDVAVERLLAAIHHYEKVLIFGDYDADGTASASLLYGYLKRLGARVHYYIPHRIHDGYGFTPATVDKIRDWQVDLVITTDHGSTDVEGPRLLGREGIDLIITDHHQLGPEMPAAVALVNPQRPDCPYPFKGLCGAGVAYKLICALDERLIADDFFEQRGLCHTAPSYFLDLVALATVADMAPLLGENRVLVKLGLEQLNTRPKPGLSGLIKECRVRGLITPSVISFKLAPKINALGRIGDPRVGMQLLLSRSYTESRRLARDLLSANRMRQEIEREAFTHACQQMDHMPARPALVLVGLDWHPGVIGTLATRIAAQTGKPTVVLTLRDAPQVYGSARSSTGFNVLAALELCADLLERYGGHPAAAGLMLEAERVADFTRCFLTAAEQAEGAGDEAQAHDPLRIEAWLDPDHLTHSLLAQMDRLQPFGYHNPEPVLAVRGLRVGRANVLNNRHLRFQLRPNPGEELEAYAWDHADWSVDPGHPYDMAFVPHCTADSAPPQLRVVDLKPSEER